MIESLQSPHVARVKALLSSKKERAEAAKFIAEGLQSVREALKISDAIEVLYLSSSGRERLVKAVGELPNINVVDVSDKVINAMSDAITSQGIVAICHMKSREVSEISKLAGKHIIYLNEIQDPGNAGTILRSADAMNLAAIVTSTGSVDFYSPKVVRSTAGSLWHIPVFDGVTIAQLKEQLPQHILYVLDGASKDKLDEIDFSKPAIWIFGNEARGVQENIRDAKRISIQMPGNAESLNLAAAASIVMYQISREL
jgi:TrmH family RNA methyltransferase